LHLHVKDSEKYEHSLAYSVGLVHGLAGSGALIVMVMSQIQFAADGLMYLCIFCAGCIAGMLVAAGIFSIPFSRRITNARILQVCLIIISSALCILYGSKVIYENVFYR